MTIDSSLSKIRYIGNGVTTTFSIPFAYLTNNDGSAQLAVYVGDSDTPLVEGEDYTIVGLGQAVAIDDDVEFATYEERFDGGDVVFVVAPEQGVPVAVVRNVPQTQGVVFVEGEKFPAQDFENALDKLTMEVQEVKENLQRAIVLPPTSTEKPIEARDAILLARDEAKTAAENALASEQASLENAETATLAAQEANLAKESAEISKDAILNDAGFQVVAADLQGENKIGYVADNLDSVADKVDIANNAATAAQEAAQSAATAAQEAKDTIAAETGAAIAEINNVKDSAISDIYTQIDGVVDEVNAVAASASSSATAAANSAIRSENSAVRAEEAEQRIMESGALPSQAGNEGKFLTTDGTEASWADVGGGLEIGDIGIAPLGIDEAQNKRRYLNGQVISQSQFESFTNKIKEAIAVNSNLGATEENWQAEVTNSKLGQCGKFVIDDELGTIRLPKVVNINGLQDLALMGSIKAESLPEIAGEFAGTGLRGMSVATGAFHDIYGYGGGIGSGSAGNGCGVRFNASYSNPVYQANAPVQQEAIQYPYFIQVATGTEESVDVTREIELNNPFSLLDYKWSEYEISNASWLLSNGQFNSGATYISVYNLLLEIYNGTVTKDGVSVKLNEQPMYAYSLSGQYTYWIASETATIGQDIYGYEPFRVCGKVINVTDTSITIHDDIANQDRTATRAANEDITASIYTDTDFVINTADTTFRLPIKVKLASGNAVVGNGMALGFENPTGTAGLYNLGSNGNLIARTTAYGQATGVVGGTDLNSDSTIGITTDPTKSGIETSSSGLKLYFYVGETIQDANVINASQVLTRVAELSDSYISGLGIPDYSAGISIAPYNTEVTVATAGVIAGEFSAASNGYMALYINGTLVEQVGSEVNQRCRSTFYAQVDKADIVKIECSGNYQTFLCNFFPLKGVN